MKTYSDLLHSSAPSPTIRRTLLSFTLIAALAIPAVAAAAAKPAPEPKTHTLFMGADFQLERDKQFYHVQDVSGGSLVIEVGGQAVRVPTNSGSLNLKIDQSLKLTESSGVTVQSFKNARAYTPANDPNRKWAAAQSEALSAAYAVESATHNLAVAQESAGERSRVISSGSAAAASSAEVDVSGPTAALSRAVSTNQGDLSNAGYLTGKLEKELALELFDAVEVSFEVSSATPVPSPYLFIVARYRGPEDKPGTVRSWIYAKAIDPIGSVSRKVTFRQGGFPPGFTLEDVQLHLYTAGREIASNVAPKRVELTRSEAFLYIVADYIGTHRGATLPATPAMSDLSGDRRARLTADQLQQTYYVRVAKDGRVVAAYADEACRTQVDDPALLAAVQSVLFKPALEKGKPVEAVAALNLGRLSI